MTVADIRDIALRLQGATEDIKWREHLCFSVGGKMFLITSPDAFPPTCAFKVPAEDFDELISREGFTRHSHIGRYNWVHLNNINHFGPVEWENYIKQSYVLVTERLPLKKKKEIGL